MLSLMISVYISDVLLKSLSTSSFHKLLDPNIHASFIIFQFYPHISLWKSTTVGQLLARSISCLALLSSDLEIEYIYQDTQNGQLRSKILPLKVHQLSYTSYIHVCTTDINRRMTTRS